VPGIEIGAKDRVLFRGRHGNAHFTGDVGVAAHDAAHALGRAEIPGDHADRNAGAASLASGAVGNGLAAAKAALRENVVKLAGAFADQVRKHLPLLAPAQIRARRRSGEIELRCVTRMLGHGRYDTATVESKAAITSPGRLVASKAISASAGRARPYRGSPALRINQHGADQDVM